MSIIEITTNRTFQITANLAELKVLASILGRMDRHTAQELGATLYNDTTVLHIYTVIKDMIRQPEE